MRHQKAIKQAKGMIYGAAPGSQSGSPAPQQQPPQSQPLPPQSQQQPSSQPQQQPPSANNVLTSPPATNQPTGPLSPTLKNSSDATAVMLKQATRISHPVGRSLSNERGKGGIQAGTFGNPAGSNLAGVGNNWTSGAQSLAPGGDVVVVPSQQQPHHRSKGHSVSRSNAHGMSYRSSGRTHHHHQNQTNLLGQSVGATAAHHAGTSLTGHPIFVNAELKSVLQTSSQNQGAATTTSPRKSRHQANGGHSLTIPIGTSSSNHANQLLSSANGGGSSAKNATSYNLRSPTNFVIGSIGSAATNGLTTQANNANNKLVRYKQHGSSRNASNPHHMNSITHPPSGKVMDFVRKQNAGYNSLGQQPTEQPPQLSSQQFSEPVQDSLINNAVGTGANGQRKHATLSPEKQNSTTNNQRNNGRTHHGNERVSSTASPLATRSQQVPPATFASPQNQNQSREVGGNSFNTSTNSPNLFLQSNVNTNNSSQQPPGGAPKIKGPTVEELTKQRDHSSIVTSPPNASKPFQLIGQQNPTKFKLSTTTNPASAQGSSSLATSYLQGPQGTFNKRSAATAEGAPKSSNNWTLNVDHHNQKKQSLLQPSSYNRTMPSPPSKRPTGLMPSMQQQSNGSSDNSGTEQLILNSNLNKPQTSPKSVTQPPGTLPQFKGIHQASKGMAPPVQSLMIKPGTSNPNRAGSNGRNVTTTVTNRFDAEQQNSSDSAGMMVDQIILDEASANSNGGLSQLQAQQLLLLDRPNSSSAQPLQLSHVQLPNFESTKYSVKENGVVKAYAANTNQGIVRDYNEDRVSIVLNMQKPPQKKCERWPKCSFFAIFDGHGGHTCADFLRDNLHQFIIRDSEFPNNPRQAIINGFWKSEMYFLDTVEKFSAGRSNMLDRSGSCAIVTLFVDDLCFSANVGDSRAIMSCSGGRYAVALSQDHKPNEKEEHQRIISAGGKIYQTQSVTKVQDENGKPGQMREQILLGPHRVFPGRLSVSRTFGDIEAKRTKYQGNPKVVIATPDIKCFKIEDNYDFIVLGCDGIYDKLTNTQVVQAGWEAAKKNFKDRGQPIHQNCGTAVEAILKSSVAERSLDNITVVIIAFKNFRKSLKREMDKFQEDLQKQRSGATELQNKSSALMTSWQNNDSANGGPSAPNVPNSTSTGQPSQLQQLEDQHAAEQIENKRLIPSETRKESGIVISKTLNLPNYDLTLQDVEVQPTLVGLARLQKLTTGSRSTSNGRSSSGVSPQLISGFSASNGGVPHPFGHQNGAGSGLSSATGGGFFNSSSSSANNNGSSLLDGSAASGQDSALLNHQTSADLSSPVDGAFSGLALAANTASQHHHNKSHHEQSRPAPPEKQQFIMNRRRGTAGPMNPKQNVHTDLLIQSKIGGHPNFIKTRQRSPMLPSAIGGHAQQIVPPNLQQVNVGRPVMHGGVNSTTNKQTPFEPVVTKPSSSNMAAANSIGNKGPQRHAYGVFTTSSAVSSNPVASQKTGGGGHTSNGLRNNSMGAAANQNHPGMAESLRAQIATPRNNSVNLEEQQQLAQHRRYTNILSQSRARRQIGGSQPIT